MRAVGLKALKNKLGEYVRLAAGGETVLVTDHDRVVAELGPPCAGRATLVSDALLAEALREGWIHGPLHASDVPPRQPVSSWDELTRDVAQDRSDR
jgi:antitoxin (DNA-binding transcriptional repressor) of toxin-antitoxin stability system